MAKNKVSPNAMNIRRKPQTINQATKFVKVSEVRLNQFSIITIGTLIAIIPDFQNGYVWGDMLYMVNKEGLRNFFQEIESEIFNLGLKSRK